MEFLQQMAQDRFNSVKAFCEDMQRVELMSRMENARLSISFLPKLNAREDVAVVAEFKRLDPIEGDILPDGDGIAFAKAAEEGGAFMLSYWVEPSEFDGAYEDLYDASHVSDLPILASDFVVAPEQFPIYRACGADAALIHMPITTNCCGAFVNLCPRTGLTPLVEVRNMDELYLALDANAPAIVVTATDLDSEVSDLDAVLPVVTAAKKRGKLVFVKDGVSCRADVEKVAAAGGDAVIVSTPLLRSDDVAAAVRGLSGVPRKKATRRTLIKVDGLTDPRDAAELVKMDVDAVGIEFTPGKARRIESNEAAKALCDVLPRRVASCGMFSDVGRVAIERAIAEAGFLYSEYCGDTEDHVLASRSSNDVWRRFKIDSRIPLDAIAKYGRELAYIVLAPEDGEETLDWDSIGILPAQGLYYVAGGLKVDNVEKAMAALHPDGVVFEAPEGAEPGRIDLAAVEAFIDAVRAADDKLYASK